MAIDSRTAGARRSWRGDCSGKSSLELGTQCAIYIHHHDTSPRCLSSSSRDCLGSLHHRRPQTKKGTPKKWLRRRETKGDDRRQREARSTATQQSHPHEGRQRETKGDKGRQSETKGDKGRQMETKGDKGRQRETRSPGTRQQSSECRQSLNEFRTPTIDCLGNKELEE